LLSVWLHFAGKRKQYSQEAHVVPYGNEIAFSTACTEKSHTQADKKEWQIKYE
jgi:hypothetical protein